VELDNPVWHALNGPQATVAEGSSLARRYQPDVALFSGLPDDVPAEAWDELRTLVSPGGVAVLVRDALAAPAGWDQVFSLPAIQMLATSVDGEQETEARPLTADDVPEMVAIVERTHPGPFGTRTIELGEYFGIRDDDGGLIAMAGERLFAPPYREISAVCTDEGHRGKGIGTRLVRHLVFRMRERGETPILHAAADNTNAIRLYETLGFTVTREFTVSGYRAPV
jgi:ribosomal protein S18 acetylase RimI-like enzyme